MKTSSSTMDSAEPMDNSEVRKLIDRILYLASLVSQRKDIDPMMDALRSATSRWKDDNPMEPADQRALRRLEDQLKDYLVTRDPLRSFTRESLEARLGEHTKERRARPAVHPMIVTISGSLVVGCLTFLLPINLQARALLSVSVFFLALHIGIARFYITGLKNFKSEFRTAYIFLAAAAIGLSIGFSHYVVINLLQLDRFAIFQYGGVTWLIGVPFILTFLGLRKYARLLQLKTSATSLTLAGGLVAAIALAVLILPHTKVAEPTYFHIWVIGAWMIPLFALLSSTLARKIRQAVTPAYAKSMNWLYYYTLVVGLGSILADSILFWSGELYGDQLAAVIAGCGIPPQMVLLYTSYLFKKETSK